ncbi:MAG: tautomerase family protein [Candidatus Omnitrophica bacterium]|nr:tautomerase family protein [Candidatus Omnitrophota bacterium]
MPLVKLSVSTTVADDKREEVLKGTSKIITEYTGKPERYVMVTLATEAVMLAGSSGAGAFADIRGIGGLTPEVNKKISDKLCNLLNQTLRIPTVRTYITFTDVPASNWGWNGSTFG